MDWTKEQSEAIELRGKTILVAAAAGSGKTAVLVERIRRLVCEEGASLRSLLVVTFTNAAAAEMKEKIRRSLEPSRRKKREIESGASTSAGSLPNFRRRRYAHSTPLLLK